MQQATIRAVRGRTPLCIGAANDRGAVQVKRLEPVSWREKAGTTCGLVGYVIFHNHQNVGATFLRIFVSE